MEKTSLLLLNSGNPLAKLFLEEHNPSISTVSIAELIQGARGSLELATVSKLCISLQEVVIDKKISYRAVDLLRKSYLFHGLFFLDALIAATAIEKNMTLVTGNIKHFKNIPGLRFIPQDMVFNEQKNT